MNFQCVSNNSGVEFEQNAFGNQCKIGTLCLTQFPLNFTVLGFHFGVKFGSEVDQNLGRGTSFPEVAKDVPQTQPQTPLDAPRRSLGHSRALLEASSLQHVPTLWGYCQFIVVSLHLFRQNCARRLRRMDGGENRIKRAL